MTNYNNRLVEAGSKPAHVFMINIINPAGAL